MASVSSSLPRIYLDNAATSWPKPEAVYQAVDYYLRNNGAPAGRGNYREASEVDRQLTKLRKTLSMLLGAESPDSIVFTFNGTDSLNLAIHGLLQQGDHVVTTAAEHNSVLRPLNDLEKRGTIEVTRVPCDEQGYVSPEDVRQAMQANTRLVAVVHASNVTGAVQPVAEIAKIAHQREALLLLDAAQSAGHLPIDVRALDVDLLATAGHKGLLGPLGTGVLYVRPGLEQRVRSVRQGGTGTRSRDDSQPDTMPDKYEVGNLNVAGLLGLEAGVEYLWQRGVVHIHQQELALTERLLAGLLEAPGVKLHGPRAAGSGSPRVGVVSITLDGYDPQEVATVLDAHYRIQVRSGLHCAPLIHQSLGTLGGGGTIRFSLGAFSTAEQVDAAVSAVQQIVGSTVSG